MSKMSKGTIIFALLVFLAALVAGCGPSPRQTEVKRMDKETVKNWLGDPAVMIIDVRATGDWEDSDKKVEGAVRQDPNKSASWGKDVPKDKRIVLYCAWPNEATSARVAQELIDMGYSQVVVLKGGWEEWEEAGFPTQPKE